MNSNNNILINKTFCFQVQAELKFFTTSNCVYEVSALELYFNMLTERSPHKFEFFRRSLDDVN
jgi:hypothetical protein